MTTAPFASLSLRSLGLFSLRSLTSTAALALLLALAACGTRAKAASTSPAPEAAVHVDTAPVAERALPRRLTLTGTLTANRASGVAADAVGKVAATLVERGSVVRQGAPLVRLDRRSAELAASEARAQATAARAQAALAKADCQRAENLFAASAINRAEYDRAKAGCEASGQAAAAAEARRGLAAKTLGDLIVRAPFAGVVADRFVNQGEYVRPDTRVAQIVDLSQLRVELAVPEHALAKLATGTDVRFTVAAYPGESFRATVRFVGAEVRRATRDLIVEAVVANTDGRLRPGMFAVAEVPLGEAATLVVPASAVRRGDGGSDRVFVVANGRVQERLVRAGAAAGEVVAVADGVRAGEAVVVAPPDTLADGQRVE
jgi:RND family efflux transporter MFP subunit